MRFTLERGTWYACEIIGDEFGEDKCSYSPIKVLEVAPGKTGKGLFTLGFRHLNYPEGVQSKEYKLQKKGYPPSAFTSCVPLHSG